MRIKLCLAAAAIATTLTGCYTYPVYQPVAVQRLTPAQAAALNNQQLSQADRDRLARDNAQVAREDQAAQTYTYAAPAAPVYVAPPAAYYDPYWYGGYPAYYGWGGYPFYPAVGLSFGFGGRWGGHGYYHGGFRHR